MRLVRCARLIAKADCCQDGVRVRRPAKNKFFLTHLKSRKSLIKNIPQDGKSCPAEYG